MPKIDVKYDPKTNTHRISEETSLSNVVKFRCSDEFLKILNTAKAKYELSTSDLLREAVIRLLIER